MGTRIVERFTKSERIILLCGVIAVLFALWACISTMIQLFQVKQIQADIPTEFTHTVYVIVQEEAESTPTEPVEEPEELPYTEEEINLLATLVMAEAGNQSELGKRLVIDTVLNRVDHEAFPDTIYDVIYQPNQFSPATYGTINNYYPTEEHIQLVKEEMERRTEHNVHFFRADRYGQYGIPLYCVGDHYFSSYD